MLRLPQNDAAITLKTAIKWLGDWLHFLHIKAENSQIFTVKIEVEDPSSAFWAGPCGPSLSVVCIATVIPHVDTVQADTPPK